MKSVTRTQTDGVVLVDLLKDGAFGFESGTNYSVEDE